MKKCFLLLTIVQLISSYTILVQPTEKVCFFETLEKGSRMMFGYQVQDGPTFEINAVVYIKL
jgi:hypothetical protein